MAVPWHLVRYTIPSVLIGGQIGPYVQGWLPQRVMERTISGLFFIIGVAMIYIAVAV